jgi:uncharacterized protein involved in outer membrane biogenesis
MTRKIVVAVLIVLIVGSAGLWFWARYVLNNDAVRSALAAQLSKALGQPVTVASISAGVYPRVTVSLEGVTVGEPARITIGAIDVGTGLGALLSRRIEHATLRVADARVQLPLPPLNLGTGSSSGGSGAPVELVSVDHVSLTGIELVSRGRVLRGDIDIVPHGTSAATIRQIALVADSARIDATGELTNLAGPVGTIDVKAGALDLDQLTAFASDFVEGAGGAAAGGSSAAPPQTPPSAAVPPDLTVTMAADRATMAGISMDRLSGRARLHGDTVTVDPMTFNLFGGRYSGTIGATLSGTPTFQWKAALENLDVAAITAFAGNPGVITGRLNAQVDLSGSGIDAASAMKTARGTAKVTVVNGVVRNLALVKSAVAATSLDPQAVVASSQGPHDEPFSELGASLAIASGTASTPDLHFISKDIRLDAGGALRLDGGAVNLQGQIVMSEELSKQANPAILRVAAHDGRITLPVTLTGSASKYSVAIDTSGLATRAATDELKRQTEGAVRKGLGGLLRR